MRSRPPASLIRPLRSCHSWASWRRPPETLPVLFAFSAMNGEKISSDTTKAPAAVSAPARGVAEDAGPEPADALEHARRAQAAQHAGGRGRHDEVALVAGEPRLGHPGHDHEPGEAAERHGQRQCARARWRTHITRA